MPADDQDCSMKSSALTDKSTVPAQEVCLAFGVLASSPHTGTVNKLSAWIFLFILHHLHLLYCIIVFRGGISLVHLSTSRVVSDTISVTIGYIGIKRFCYVTLCTTQHIVASKAGNEPVPHAACGNSSISHNHLTEMCLNLTPKMIFS